MVIKPKFTSLINLLSFSKSPEGRNEMNTDQTAKDPIFEFHIFLRMIYIQEIQYSANILMINIRYHYEGPYSFHN